MFSSFDMVHFGHANALRQVSIKCDEGYCFMSNWYLDDTTTVVSMILSLETCRSVVI